MQDIFWNLYMTAVVLELRRIGQQANRIRVYKHSTVFVVYYGEESIMCCFYFGQCIDVRQEYSVWKYWRETLYWLSINRVLPVPWCSCTLFSGVWIQYHAILCYKKSKHLRNICLLSERWLQSFCCHNVRILKIAKWNR